MTETTDPTARQLEQDRMYLENSRVEWDPVYLRAAGLRLLAALESLRRERDEAYALGPHPIEQAQHIPLPQFIKTRFVPTWEFNEAVSRAEAAKAAIESHRKERDRYEKASEVAMQALKQQAEAAEAKLTKLDRTITAILRKLAIRLNANDTGALDAAKDVLRAVLEELSPETSLDELLAVDDTTARHLLLFPHGQTHDQE